MCICTCGDARTGGFRVLIDPDCRAKNALSGIKPTCSSCAHDQFFRSSSVEHNCNDDMMLSLTFIKHLDEGAYTVAYVVQSAPFTRR